MLILRKALRSIGLRLALVALLLAAQQGALTHTLTHAGWQAQGHTAHAHDRGQHEAHDHVAHDNGAPERFASKACAFDLVYSQVLGGVHTGFAVHAAPTAAIVQLAATPQFRGVATFVPYDSRGPPVFS